MASLTRLLSAALRGSARARPSRCLAIALLLSQAMGASARADRLDEALYAQLLQEYTRDVADLAGTRVDYPGLAREPRWRELVAGLVPVRPARTTRSERLAFWINAYNILAIETVVRHWPLDSIRDVGSLWRPVWKREAGRVAGRTVSLGEIEHEILRPMDEPRIHAAIVCASTSCPSLMREPFTAARLDEQLDAALTRFASDPRKGLRIDRERGVVTLSRVFDWFEEDFESRGGVIEVVARRLPDEQRRWLLVPGRSARIEYFDYDWRVNALSFSSP